MSQWKTIWENRAACIDNIHDEKELFLALKRGNGFDAAGDGMDYDALEQQYRKIKEKLFFRYSGKDKSVYEIGCGDGASLFMFERDGIRCGGLDYSESLLEDARKVLRTRDLVCDEACNLDTTQKYDALLSNSVFSYFTDTTYAECVLERMYQKANYSIGLIDIHDKTKEDAFLEFRRKSIANYDERYRGLEKLFYEKAFFERFAAEYHMKLIFEESDVAGYWNNEFVFHCYMYKE